MNTTPSWLAFVYPAALALIGVFTAWIGRKGPKSSDSLAKLKVYGKLYQILEDVFEKARLEVLIKRELDSLAAASANDGGPKFWNRFVLVPLIVLWILCASSISLLVVKPVFQPQGIKIVDAVTTGLGYLEITLIVWIASSMVPIISSGIKEQRADRKKAKRVKEIPVEKNAAD